MQMRTLARGRERFRCEQPPYSIFVRGIEASVLPTCQKYGMGVIAWSPLAGGWLTGRIRKDTGVDMTTGRAQRLPQRFDPSLPGNAAKLAAVEELIKIAAARQPPFATFREGDAASSVTLCPGFAVQRSGREG